jgi:FeS assembly protein IscX
MRWTDVEAIVLKLRKAYPDVDPLTVRFTDLHRWVIALPDFSDDPKNSNEKKLETIQMVWYEEYQEDQNN